MNVTIKNVIVHILGVQMVLKGDITTSDANYYKLYDKDHKTQYIFPKSAAVIEITDVL
jgi:hypothetical protein